MTEQGPVRRRRRWMLPLAAIAAVVVYGIVVLLYAGSFGSSSEVCDSAPAAEKAADYAEVAIQPSGVLAAGQRIEIDVAFEPSASLIEGDGLTISRDIGLLVNPVDGPQVVSLKAGDVIGTSSQSLLAEGVVEQWPFDRYRTVLNTVAFTGVGEDRAFIPTYVCIQGSVPGWSFDAEMVHGTGNTVTTEAGEVPLDGIAITATRSASTVAFGIVLLGLMAVIPVLVLFVAISAYTGRRKVEATLTSWIGAMLFATIPLRNFLPGSPPVGSWIDYLVVLWVIVGLVVGLTIYILAWNRWGTRASPR